jgi:hypothetical protein
MKLVGMVSGSDGRVKVRVRLEIVTKADGSNGALSRDEAQIIGKSLRGALMEAIPRLPYSDIKLCDIKVR